MNTWTWNTAGVTPGGYYVTVRVRNAGSTAAYEAFKTMSYTITASAPVSSATLTSSPASSQAAGLPVTFTAGASGGSGSYQYQFWLYSNSTWSIVKGYSSSNTWSWNTMGVTPGGYYVTVRVKNAGSTAAYEAFKTMSYTITASTPVSSATLTSSPAGSQTAGSPVLFTAGASGGTGSYEYQFWLYTGSAWVLRREYAATNTWTWDTTGVTPGGYYVTVRVRNAGSTATYEAFKTMSYTIN